MNQRGKSAPAQIPLVVARPFEISPPEPVIHTLGPVLKSLLNKYTAHSFTPLYT